MRNKGLLIVRFTGLTALITAEETADAMGDGVGGSVAGSELIDINDDRISSDQFELPAGWKKVSWN